MYTEYSHKSYVVRKSLCLKFGQVSLCFACFWRV